MIAVSYSRTKIVDQAKSWLGRKEADGSHKEIINVYNSHTPRARGYSVKYTDAWCAAFVSACAIKCGYTDIIPTECGCQQMITLFKNMGCWVENDAYVPSPGDFIFYDWQDNGVGDNTGASDHVGIVERVSGNTIVIIEGNYSDSVKRRSLKVNGQYIRGYGIPNYDAEMPVAAAPSESDDTDIFKKYPMLNATVRADDPAKSKQDSLAGTYITTANLNMRHGAGTNKQVMTIIPKNTKVENYGFYTELYGTKWLYVQVIVKDAQYTGFCSSKYLDKI